MVHCVCSGASPHRPGVDQPGQETPGQISAELLDLGPRAVDLGPRPVGLMVDHTLGALSAVRVLLPPRLAAAPTHFTEYIYT